MTLDTTIHKQTQIT